MATKPAFLDYAAEVPTATPGDTLPNSVEGLMLFPVTFGGATKWYSKDVAGVVTLLTGLTTLLTGVKDIEGTVYVDPTNTQNWAGADAGAWINSAFTYGMAQYGANYGFTIKLAPGQYNYTTPIVCGVTGFSVIFEGAGDGNGGTVLNYTPTTATKGITLAGGSGNRGGVIFRQLSLKGAGMANPTTGVFWGVNGTGSIAGALMEQVSIDGFGTGEDMLTNGQAYAITHVNCKIQTCATATHPFGENHTWYGGLISATTGVLGDRAAEVQMFGTAFDDCGAGGAVSSSHALFRMTQSGCRYENPSLGTSQYIVQTAGSINMHGGGFQEDNVSGGPATGFVNASGGTFTCRDTWLYSGGRVLTQAFNLSGSVIARLAPMISPSSAGITTIAQAGFTDKGVLNTLAAPVAVPVTTETLVMNGRIPANAASVGQVYRFKATAILAGADVCTWRIRNGAAGTVADATIADIVVTAAGFLNGRSTYEGELTIRSIGGAGTLEGEGKATTSTAANAAAVAQTTAAAAATTAVVTNAAWFIDITLATTIAGATVVQAIIEAVV